jgi:hypothetical protein
VWAGEEKIASIGIAVRRWVSYHGFALNVTPDLKCFELIHPCGLRGIHMTSMAARLGAQTPSLAAVRTAVVSRLAKQLGHDRVQWIPEQHVRRQLTEFAETGPEQPSRTALNPTPGPDGPARAVGREAGDGVQPMISGGRA